MPLDDYLDAIVAGRMSIEDVLNEAMSRASRSRR
jgi:hypothetical protein